MSDNIVRFIIDRIVADYTRLWKVGPVPDVDTYAALWQNTARTGVDWAAYGEDLVHRIIATDFQLSLNADPNLSLERFLKKQPTRLQNDVPLCFKLLEIELDAAEEEPNLETVRQRFPQLDSDRLTQTIELVRLRRSWRPKKETVKQTVPVQKEPVQDAVDQQTVEVNPIAPAQQDSWTPEKSQTCQWTNEQLASIQAEGTLDYQPASEPPVEGTLDYQPPSEVPVEGTLDYQPPSEPSVEGTLEYQPPSEPSVEGTLDYQPPSEPPVEGTLDYQPAKQEPTPAAAATPAAPPAKAGRAGLTEVKEFRIGDTVTVDKYLGSGCWKDVYKAEQKSTRQFVALKHLRENNKAEREALVREVRTQAMLTHQNIPPVFGLDILPSGQALVIEKLVDGERWSDSIKTRSLEDNLRVLLEVSQAVAYAHRQHQIIHRDLKPDNVVVNDHYGEVYLIDWGLAADVGETVTESEDKVPHVRTLNEVAGTPLYWPPELASGEPWKCTTATDVFLLGALLYEILTGHAPYELFTPSEGPSDEPVFVEPGPMIRSICGMIVPPKQRAPKRYMPDELVVIAQKALAREVGDRYADAGEFIDAIKQYQLFSIITNRCDQNWLHFRALRKERTLSTNDPTSLHSLTLRFLETSDVFKSIISELELHQLADDVQAGEVGSESTVHPTLDSARHGEVESRTELIALTIETGDLTLADAQIGLIAHNPLRDAKKTDEMRTRVRSLRAARRRARMMKWVAVALLAIFLGSSTLYGYLINEQFKKTETQYRRAEENFQKAQNAVNDFYTTVAKDDSIKNSGLMQLRRKLLDSARKYHEDFVSQKSDDPDVLAGQVGSLFDIAGIEAGFGNWTEATDYYLKAINLGNELAAQFPKNAKYLDILSKSYKDLGVVYGKRGFSDEEVMECYLKALPINRRLVDQFGDVPEYHRNLARILHNIAQLESKAGRSQKAETYFRDSLRVRDGMLRFSDPIEFHYGKAQTCCALGLLYAVTDRIDEAEHEFENAIQLLEDLKKEKPDQFGNEELTLQGAILFGRGEMNLNEKRYAASRAFLLQSLEPFALLVEKAPEHILYQRQLDNAQVLIFRSLVGENKFDEALELFQQREDELLNSPVIFSELFYTLCQWYLRIAEFHLSQGREDEAIKNLLSGVEYLDALEDDRSSDEDHLLETIQNRLKKLHEPEE